MARWRCTVCQYMYDESAGEPATGTPAGTSFPDLPAEWRCPICGAGKAAFLPEDTRDEGGVPGTAGGNQTVSDVIIGELAAWGVDLVLSIPGTSSLGIIDAVRKRPDIRFVVVRHEENAAMIASAYNKLTGRVATCVTIAGPGATNLSTGLYDAKEDCASVLSINGQVEVQYAGPGGFQEIDQDAFFRPVTVFNNTIYDKTMTTQLVTSALRHAVIRRGVAQLSVPNNVQKEPLATGYCRREGCLSNFNILPEEREIRRAADLISGAERPVIIAGWGAFHSPDEVLRLAQKISAPILTTFRAKGILPDDNPYLLGILGTVGSAQARALAKEADLLITLGVGFSKMTGVPLDKPLVQVDLEALRLGRGSGGVPLWGNCSLVIPALTALTQERKDDTLLPKIAALKKEWDARRDEEADPGAIPIRPPYIMKVLSETIPDDAVISVDVGENGWWFGRNFRMKRQRFVMSGYLATMGFGFPGAIAAKIAYPERKVFCITGDGGFAMAMADFVTAVKYDLPMVVVILNNRQYGMIQVEQKLEKYQNFGTDLLNPDFAAFAGSCGGEGIRVKKPDDLQPAIMDAMVLDAPVIVDVDTDPKRF